LQASETTCTTPANSELHASPPAKLFGQGAEFFNAGMEMLMLCGEDEPIQWLACWQTTERQPGTEIA